MFRVGNYIQRQSNVSNRSRAIIIDWIVELQEHFELTHETIYLTVKLLDIFLDRYSIVTRDKLQILACAAVFVAAKYDVCFVILIILIIFRNVKLLFWMI